jgi:hypothetical protein
MGGYPLDPSPWQGGSAGILAARMQLTLAAHGALRASWRVLVALTLAAAPATAAPGLVEVAWHGVPGELEAGVRRTVPVELANHGDRSGIAAGYAVVPLARRGRGGGG